MLHVAECPAPPEPAGAALPAAARPAAAARRARRDRAADIPSRRLNGKCLTGNRKLASAVITAKTGAIEQMLAALAGRRDRAPGRSGAGQPRRARRRDRQLQLRRERLGQVLGRAHLRLDALRLVVHA
jgi:hypothetical protein